MSKKLRFIWIDDNPDRNIDSEILKNRLKIDIDLIDVKTKNLSEELHNVLSKEMPDLILMDHMLNNVNEGSFKTGSSATEVIREKWPECPIVCITAVPLPDMILNTHMQSIYEDVFSISEISNYDSTFLSIAQSFKLITKKRLENVDDLIKLIKAPVDDVKRMKDILPDKLKKEEAYSDKSLIMMISNWIRHTLMKKPGFLYDRLWAATLIGIKEDSFKKVEELFIEAKYNGVFVDEGNERWWQTKLREIIFSIFPDTDTIYPWVLGRELPEITEGDFSKCHVYGENLPETVAYTDETAKIWKPMRLRYTIPHPNFEKSLYFEEIRMMKAAE